MAFGRHYQGFLQIHKIFTYDDEGKKTEKVPFTSLDYSVSNENPGAYGNQQANHTMLHNVTLVRELDAASSQILGAVSEGKVGDCVIEIDKMGDESAPFITYTLKDARILNSHHTLNNHTGHFQETITLAFNRMDFQYIPMGDDNKKRPKHVFSHAADH